jgi:hypothetical protein
MNKVWLIGGVLVSCLAGAGMAACGSSSSTGGSGTGGTASTTTGAGNTGNTSTTTTGPTGTGGTAATTTTTTAGTGGTTSTGTTGTGGTAECGKVTTLHAPDLEAGPGTIYCPFSETTDGGKDEYCTPGTQFCCETAEGTSTPSSCVTGTPSSANCPSAFVSSAESGSTVWECEDPVTDCPSGQVCCAVGYGYGGTSPKAAAFTPGAPGCGNYASEMGGTVCMASSACTAAVGFLMCTSPGECPSGTTCQPFAKAGNDVGGCH